MEKYTRSKSTREGRMQHGEDGYYGDGAASAVAGPLSMHELRSYSTSYTSYIQPPPPPQPPAYAQDLTNDGKMKKSKSRVASSSKSWSFSDPELQRKKRVVSYKAYAVEGKMKGSFRKSFRWIKDVVHGLW